LFPAARGAIERDDEYEKKKLAIIGFLRFLFEKRQKFIFSKFRSLDN